MKLYIYCLKYNMSSLFSFRNQSQKLGAQNNQVAALSYDLLESQIWALLPSFCSQPSDISQVFPVCNNFI